MSWLTGKLDVNARWAHISLGWTIIFLAFSLLALLVMNFDRYLATSYPIFHRTSVTKGRLLTLLAILIIVDRNNFGSDDCKRLYFRPSTYFNYFYSFRPCNVIYQLQAVSSRQEKS
jgi:hypothetical protein